MTIAATKLITAEEFALMPDSVGRELVRGRIVSSPRPVPLIGRFANRLAFALTRHVSDRRLGEVTINDAGFLLGSSPDSVRGVDLAFVCRDRLPAGEWPEGYFVGPPDLAVDVVAASDRVFDVDDKIDMYLAAGCPLVVILHPKRRTATLHRPNVDPHVVREPELLDLSPIVDGFRCTLAELFDQ